MTAQTDTCEHQKRNICLCDWGDDCAIHSTPERIYDQIAKLRREQTEDGKRRYPLSHIDRLAEFYALVKKNYGWVSNSPAKLSRKQIADVFDCSLETAGDLVEVARQTGFVFAERNNYTENGITITKGYLITLTCTHYGIDSGGADYYGTSNPPQEADWNYAYCPNCGEKL